MTLESVPDMRGVYGEERKPTSIEHRRGANCKVADLYSLHLDVDIILIEVVVTVYLIHNRFYFTYCIFI